jgi:hypothetical protein
MWIALAAVTLKRKANGIKQEFILFPSLKPLMDYERNHSKNKRAFGTKPLDFAITFSAQILLLSHKGAAGDLGGLKEFLDIDLGLICLINFALLYRLIKDKPKEKQRKNISLEQRS